MVDISKQIDFLCRTSGLNTEKKICNYFQINLQTWRNWKKKGLKKHQFEVLRYKAGYLNQENWNGIRFLEGHLWNVHGYPIHPNMVNQIEWLISLKNSDQEMYQKDLFHNIY